MNKDYIKGIDGAERRYAVADMKVEKRAAVDGEPEAFIVEGYAAKYNSPTNIANIFEEEILPGFFDGVMDDDVRALFNHDPNYILARSAGVNPTLELWLDGVGLKYRFVTPNRSYALDLADSIQTGDVSESSFAFVAFRESEGGQEWVEREGKIPLRRLKRCKKLYDVSPVTYPAYSDTSVEVAQRSHADFLQAQKEQKEAQQRNENKGLSIIEAQLIINQNL